MTTTIKTGTEVISQPRGPRPRILVVDDEKVIRDILVMMLLADSYDIREAEDGQETIDLLATGLRIDLVTSCLMMPVMDCYSLLLHVKKHHPRIPFVVVTAIHDAAIQACVLREGADGHRFDSGSGHQVSGSLDSSTPSRQKWACWGSVLAGNLLPTSVVKSG